MNNKHSTGHIQDLVEAICDEHDAKYPVEFQTYIMLGKDPRGPHPFLLYLRDVIEELDGDAPDEEDWQQICNMAEQLLKEGLVDIKLSSDAAKGLMEYMYPKLRAIEHTVKDSTVGIIKTTMNQDEATALYLQALEGKELQEEDDNGED